MDQIIHFVTEHWILSGSFAAILIIIINGELQYFKYSKYYIDCNQAIQLINQEKAVFLDLRSADQFKLGHITDAKNYESKNLIDNFNILQKFSDQQKTIIFCCEDGTKSLELFVELKKNNKLINILILSGGINAWLDAQLPLLSNDKSNKTVGLKKIKK